MRLYLSLIHIFVEAEVARVRAHSGVQAPGNIRINGNPQLLDQLPYHQARGAG